MKQKIIKTSIQIFDEKGFSETSIQDIVDAIGVTKGTFYYYFKSKEEILRDIHIEYIDTILLQQKKILTDITKDCKAKLFNITLMLIKHIRIGGQGARIFFREKRNLSESSVEKIMKKRDQFRLNVQRLIEKGIKDGEFDSSFRADILAFAILGVTNWSYHWYNPKGEVSEEELADMYMNMILHGISSKE
jgi:AcrR family transcriptional regulator